MKNKLATLLLPLSFFIFTGASQADNSLGVSSIAIPASMCQPADSESAAKLWLDAFWGYKEGQTGVANLKCPLPLGYNSGNNYLDHFTVMFFDQDKNVSDFTLQVELRSIDRDSDISIKYMNFDAWTFPPDTGVRRPYRAQVNLTYPQTIAAEKFYWFRVIMNRTSTTGSPLEFYGISFE